MAQKRKKTSFHHPVCHFITGERLHYVLLKVKTKLYSAGEKIEHVITDRNLGISGSSCAYFIFGDSDVLVRLWATESHLEKFKQAIQAQVPEVENIQVILVERISTWFQRRLEDRKGWWEALDEKAVSKIANHEVPDSLRVEVGLKPNPNGVKFFIFIEEPFAKTSGIFGKLHDDLISKHIDILKGMDKVSLYSYVASDGVGTLVKGEVREARDLTITLLAFAEQMKNYAVKTTTFICAKTIKLDESALNSRLKELGRDKEILYNLVRSHDCHHASIAAYGGEEAQNRARRFEEIGAEFSKRIFLFRSEGWWASVSDLRLLYKWVAFGDPKKLCQKLGQEYVKLDRKLNSVLDEAFQRVRDEKLRQRQGGIARTHGVDELTIGKIITALSSELRFEKHCTLGAVPACIESLVKTIENAGGLAREDRDGLLEFAKALKLSAKDRDELMHGVVDPDGLLEAEEDNKNRWVWERFVRNYLNTFLLLPSVLPKLVHIADAFLRRSAPPSNPNA